MFMWRQLFRCATMIGLCSAGSAEQQTLILERYDGVLSFSKTNIHFEGREVDRKLANVHAELVLGKSAA